MGVKEVSAREGAAGISATLSDDAWLGAVTVVGLADGTDALSGHAVGCRAGTELEAGAADGAGVTAGAAAGF